MSQREVYPHFAEHCKCFFCDSPHFSRFPQGRRDGRRRRGPQAATVCFQPTRAPASGEGKQACPVDLSSPNGQVTAGGPARHGMHVPRRSLLSRKKGRSAFPAAWQCRCPASGRMRAFPPAESRPARAQTLSAVDVLTASDVAAHSRRSPTSRRIRAAQSFFPYATWRSPAFRQGDMHPRRQVHVDDRASTALRQDQRVAQASQPARRTARIEAEGLASTSTWKDEENAAVCRGRINSAVKVPD